MTINQTDMDQEVQSLDAIFDGLDQATRRPDHGLILVIDSVGVGANALVTHWLSHRVKKPYLRIETGCQGQSPDGFGHQLLSLLGTLNIPYQRSNEVLFHMELKKLNDSGSEALDIQVLSYLFSLALQIRKDAYLFISHGERFDPSVYRSLEILAGSLPKDFRIIICTSDVKTALIGGCHPIILGEINISLSDKKSAIPKEKAALCQLIGAMYHETGNHEQGRSYIEKALAYAGGTTKKSLSVLHRDWLVLNLKTMAKPWFLTYKLSKVKAEHKHQMRLDLLENLIRDTWATHDNLGFFYLLQLLGQQKHQLDQTHLALTLAGLALINLHFLEAPQEAKKIVALSKMKEVTRTRTALSDFLTAAYLDPYIQQEENSLASYQAIKANQGSLVHPFIDPGLGDRMDRLKGLLDGDNPVIVHDPKAIIRNPLDYDALIRWTYQEGFHLTANQESDYAAKRKLAKKMIKRLRRLSGPRRHGGTPNHVEDLLMAYKGLRPVLRSMAPDPSAPIEELQEISISMASEVSEVQSSSIALVNLEDQEFDQSRQLALKDMEILVKNIRRKGLYKGFVDTLASVMEAYEELVVFDDTCQVLAGVFIRPDLEVRGSLDRSPHISSKMVAYMMEHGESVKIMADFTHKLASYDPVLLDRHGLQLICRPLSDKIYLYATSQDPIGPDLDHRVERLCSQYLYLIEQEQEAGI